jgi:hypothetical protein
MSRYKSSEAESAENTKKYHDKRGRIYLGARYVSLSLLIFLTINVVLTALRWLSISLSSPPAMRPEHFGPLSAT